MLKLNLSQEIETRVREEAMRRGIAAEDYAAHLVADSLPSPSAPEPSAAAAAEHSLSDLFSKWAQDDETEDPTEIERRNAEFEELKEAMNQSRLEMEGPNSRKLWP